MTQVTIEQAMQIAVGHYQAGRLQNAELTCREILSTHPNQPNALNLLAAIASRVSRYAEAADLIRKAITISPTNASYHFNLGTYLQMQDKLDEAIASYEQALVLRPNYPEAHYNLGNAWTNKNQLDQAIRCYQQAIALKPNYPEAHDNLGIVLQMRGQLDDAIAAHHRALVIQPTLAKAHNNLGTAFSKKRQFDDAIASFQQALRLQPDYPQAHNGLANALLELGEIDQAISSSQRALTLRPDYPDAHNNLGHAQMDKGLTDQAITSFQRALELKPNDPDTLNNLGSAMVTKNKLLQAEQFFRAAIAAQPDHASAHWNLGLLHLFQGDYAQGLPLYEWRKKVPGLITSPSPPGSQWDGSDLSGRRILIHAEQAFGDYFQCARYIPLIAQRGGKVILSIPPELKRLMQCLKPIEQFTSPNDALPDYDVHCPITSLPLAFNTTLQTIPAEVPYLKSSDELKHRWQSRLPTDNRLKVGLTWLGRRKPDPLRAIPPEELSPLAKLDGIWFCGLQKPRATLSPGLQLADFSDDLHDFADTAALIENLDLIITIDTSIAHLAGALSKPVWVLLKEVPDWRWMLDRPDSPWYPTMRLFRQKTLGQWQAPINQIIDELATLAENWGTRIRT